MNRPEINKVIPKYIHNDVKHLKEVGYDLVEILKMLDADMYPDFLVDMQSTFESELAAMLDDDEADDFACDSDYDYYAIMKNYCERKLSVKGCARFTSKKLFF